MDKVNEEVWENDLKETKGLIDDMKNTKFVSDCCKDEALRSCPGFIPTRAGTKSWVCLKCNKPCDTI